MIIDRIITPILRFPRIVKRTIAMSVDAGLCVFTVWLAISLRLGDWIPLSGQGWPAALAALAIALPIFVIFGLYRSVFRYVSWEAIATITQAVFVYGIIYASVFTIVAIPGVPRTVGMIQPVLLLVAVGASRALVRYFLGGRWRRGRAARKREQRNVLIYGAGSAGRQLGLALGETAETHVVGFVDDDKAVQGSTIGRLPVWPPAKAEKIMQQYGVSEVYLAMPSATRARRNEILAQMRSAGVAVRTVPGLIDIARGDVTVSDVKPLDIEDLLGRDAVAPDAAIVERNISAKTVMVTGAGGSIGSELCRQILAGRPARLLLIESSEYSLYAIHNELTAIEAGQFDGNVEIVPLLASVCNEARIRKICEVWRPQRMYHAAAYKHVPLVEHNLIEGVLNNAVGTMVCAQAARDFGAESFVLISTDKAVRPTNAMGASKRLAEMGLQAIASEHPKTRFSMVRFGNVLDSSGSVVPLFRQQIGRGGPVTVTHPDITRFFMTIPEAVQLVIRAEAMATGGEVFVLDMGGPVKVLELAVRMIELSGLKVRNEENPFGDIEIVFTGLRPGEKLYEELLIGDNPIATDHPRVMMAREKFLPLPDYLARMERLRAAAAEQDFRTVRQIVVETVPEYVPAANAADWVILEEEKAGEPTGREAPAAAPSGKDERPPSESPRAGKVTVPPAATDHLAAT